MNPECGCHDETRDGDAVSNFLQGSSCTGEGGAGHILSAKALPPLAMILSVLDGRRKLTNTQ